MPAGRPRANASQVDGVNFRPETQEERSAARKAWIPAKAPTYEKVLMYVDGKELVKIRRKTYLKHVSAKGSTPTKITSHLVAQYKKVKGRWQKIAGGIPPERLEKLTGISLGK